MSLNKENNKKINNLLHDKEFLQEEVLDLQKEIDTFLDWYKNVFLEDKGDLIDYKYDVKLRNFIEKVAVWYELKYPNYLFSNNREIDDIKNAKLSDTKLFINKLPSDEKMYLTSTVYPESIYFNNKHQTYIKLDKNGTIQYISNIQEIFPTIEDEYLEGKNIKDALELLKDKKITSSNGNYNKIEKIISAHEQIIDVKKRILMCIMYRIILRGPNKVSPKRALLFAREFDINTSIPQMCEIENETKPLTTPLEKIKVKSFKKM